MKPCHKSTKTVFVHRGWAFSMLVRGLKNKLNLRRSTKMVGLCVTCVSGMCSGSSGVFLNDFCVISNQHGLTMPMHALSSTQELELWKLTSQGTVLSFTQQVKWMILLSRLHYNCLILSPGQEKGPDGGCWWMVGIQLFVTTKITSLMDSDRSIRQLSTRLCFLKEMCTD